MWITVVIEWLHILLGIFWFGSNLYLNVIVIPTILRLPLEQQRAVTIPLGDYTDRILAPVSVLVILLGLIRGTFFGPVRDFSTLFGTSYGITFLVAALMTTTLALWGHFGPGRAVTELNEIPLSETVRSDGTPSLAFAAQLQKVKLFVLLELIGFFLIFTAMVLMSFGV